MHKTVFILWLIKGFIYHSDVSMQIAIITVNKHQGPYIYIIYIHFFTLHHIEVFCLTSKPEVIYNHKTNQTPAITL